MLRFTAAVSDRLGARRWLYAFAPATSGEVIDVKSRKIVTKLTDEQDRPVQSEKMVEVDWSGGQITRTGDQFGVGRVTR